MKYLVSIPATTAGDEGKWTTEQEPVVPCFPSQSISSFLAIPSFKMAARAEVKDIDADPDVIVDQLAKEYPGLPRTLHENYVMCVFKAVFDKPIGTSFGVIINQKQALLVDKKTGASIALWNEQPIT